MPAGVRIPVRLMVKQGQYCQRAIGIRRFCYNLAAATTPVSPDQPAPMAQLAGRLQSLQRLQARGLPLRRESRQPCRRGGLHGLRQSRDQLAGPQHQDQSSRVQATEAHRRGLIQVRGGIGAMKNQIWFVGIVVVLTAILTLTWPSGNQAQGWWGNAPALSDLSITDQDGTAIELVFRLPMPGFGLLGPLTDSSSDTLYLEQVWSYSADVASSVENVTIDATVKRPGRIPLHLTC